MNTNQIISNAIPDLLHEHQFLVVPEFGAFILNHKGAVLKNSQGLIYPPGYWVSFNSNIRQNDGQFASYLVKTINCTIAEANDHLLSFSSYCKAILKNKARITIDGVGFFYYDLENNLCFEPGLNDWFNKESFGLTAVKLEEIIVDEPVKLNFEPKDRTLISISESKQAAGTNQSKKWQKYSIAAVIVLVSITMLSLAIINNPIKGGMLASVFSNGSSNNYSPFQYSELQLVSSDQQGKDLVFNSNGLSKMNLNGIDICVKNNNTEFASNDNAVKNIRHSIKGQFQIVVGCFSQISNAKKLVKNYTKQGLQVYLSGLNSKGMHVVSYGSYITKEEAIKELQVIKSNFPNAWVKNPD